MPFFQKSRRSQVIFIVLILLHLFLISIQVPLGGEKNYFEKAVFSLFSPVQHGFVFVCQKIGGFFSNYFFLTRVQKNNRKLKEVISALRQENEILKRTLQTLEKKKDVEAFFSSVSSSFLVTQVIGVDASNIYKSITVARGTLDGVKKDLMVLDRYGHLVGRIIPPISLKEAKVQLITDNESAVGVVTQKSRVKGVLTGDAKGNCYLEYIYATKKVDEGEELITSGFDYIYPSGVKIGKVVSITSEDPLFQRIKVKPFFNFSKLDMVVILKCDPARTFIERE